MGAVAGLLGGVGMLLIWMACTSDPPQWRSRRSRLLADILVQAGAGRTSPTMFVLGSLGLGLLIGMVFLGMSRAWPVAVSFAAIFTAIPFLIISSRARNRRTRLREVWPEAVDTLVSGVRAGMSLPEALTNLGERGPEAVRPQFRAFAADYAATARFDNSLDRLKARFADPVNGAKVAVAAPWFVLALLSTRSQAAAAYATATGAVILLAGAVVSIIAYRLMLRLGRLPEEERMLR